MATSMMDLPLVLGGVVGSVSIVLLIFLLSLNYLLSPSRTLPPGPRPIPILGNYLMMKKFASVHDFANELKRKYGPIVTFWMGSEPIVIISGPEIIHEAMITKGATFTARNRLRSTHIVSFGYRTLFTAYGERHRFLRKLVISGVLSNKRLVGYSGIRDNEVKLLIESFDEKLRGVEGGVEGGVIVTDFRHLISLTICNIVVSLVFGRKLRAEDSWCDLHEIMVERVRMGTGKLRDYMPFLGWLPDKLGDKNQADVLEKASKIFTPLIEDRRKQILDLGKSDQVTLVDTLLGLQSGEIESSIDITDSDIVANCLDLLVAGTDSTALNLEYCLANLINHPRIQEKLAEEIWAIAGERLVDENDISRLPFLQAVIMEGLRRHSPTRLSPARRALSPIILAGYKIPVNTTVLQHLEGVALSPQIWEDPLEFRPERFLNKNVDMTGSTGIALIPFGVGRRICPGINFALIHAQLILARLIQQFEWKLATTSQRLDLSPAGGPLAPMKYPLVALMQKRTRMS